jgi:hypothetical protein
MARAVRRVLAPLAPARRRLAGSRRRGFSCALPALLAALACGALPAPALAESEEAPLPVPVIVAGAPGPAPEADVPLSNDRTLTTWAHPAESLPIYAHPSVHAREITRTHAYTEDGFPEVYELLDRRVDRTGHTWIRLRVPGRPNGRVGWVLRQALGTLHVTHWRVRINLELRRLTAYEDGRRRFVAPVGVGKPSTPTPTGHFWIRELFKIQNPASPYYPWAIGTSAYSVLSDWPGGGIVGIHGPFGEPSQIPGDPSHGCVRMLPADLDRLAPLLTLGTPVDIV